MSLHTAVKAWSGDFMNRVRRRPWLLRGAGRAFSGGGDLTGNARRERPVDDYRFMEAAERFHDRVRASAVPVLSQ